MAILDLGSNLGALNRAALLTADFVVIPLAADLVSLRGLHDLGATLTGWRTGWHKRRERARRPESVDMPPGEMTPLGYVVSQHTTRRSSVPASTYRRWIGQFPQAFHTHVLDDAAPPGDDPSRIALLRHFHSLLPMAVEAKKPVFDLTAADGAIGSHAASVRDAQTAFEQLAATIGARTGVGQWAPRG